MRDIRYVVLDGPKRILQTDTNRWVIQGWCRSTAVTGWLWWKKEVHLLDFWRDLDRFGCIPGEFLGECVYYRLADAVAELRVLIYKVYEDKRWEDVVVATWKPGDRDLEMTGPIN